MTPYCPVCWLASDDADLTRHHLGLVAHGMCCSVKQTASRLGVSIAHARPMPAHVSDSVLRLTLAPKVEAPLTCHYSASVAHGMCCRLEQTAGRLGVSIALARPMPAHVSDSVLRLTLAPKVEAPLTCHYSASVAHGMCCRLEQTAGRLGVSIALARPMPAHVSDSVLPCVLARQ